MQSFSDLVKDRHSAVKFKGGVKISRDDLNKAFSVAKLAPSAFNLQPANYIVIDDEDLKERIFEISSYQYKIHLASAVILVLGDIHPEVHKEELYEPLKQLGIMSEQDYKFLMQAIDTWYSTHPEEYLKEDAVRNSMVSATMLMFALKDMGYDSCPMHIQNYDKVKALLDIPDNLHPVMMFTIGVIDNDRVHPRGFRKPIGQFVKYNKEK